jgi:predicted lipoprotein
MKKSWWITLAAVLVLVVLCVLVWPYAFTVVTIQSVEQAKASEAFDPVAYVNSIWDSKLMPTITDKAVELKTVLNEFQPDATGKEPKANLLPVVQKYGHTTVGEAHVYLVKGSGKITSVDTKSSVGYAEVTIEGYNGPVKVKLYIGPRIPSDETSLRDGVGFINFGDFKEQTEYGKVANELNKRVTADVLSKLDPQALVGKTVTFYGAFMIRTFNLLNIDLNEIRIVPIKITVE